MTMAFNLHRSQHPILAAAAVGFLAACTTQAAGPVATSPPPAPKRAVAIVAPYAPPAPLPESVPPKPAGPDGHFVWNPGHYHWSSSSSSAGTGFTWLGGHFVERPYPGSVWTNGGWNADASGAGRRAPGSSVRSTFLLLSVE
jgi:hypothetical protein